MMNIPKRLQKIGRDLQRVSVEMGNWRYLHTKNGRDIHRNDRDYDNPQQDEFGDEGPLESKGDYVAFPGQKSMRRTDPDHVAIPKSKFYAQLITEPKFSNRWDGWVAEFIAENNTKNNTTETGFFGFLGVWDGYDWKIGTDEDEIVEVDKPRRWKPPRR